MFAIRPILLAVLTTAGLAMTGPVALAAADAKAASTQQAPSVPQLSVAQILERHVAARGGEKAWKAVQAMQLTGTMEAGRGDNIARAQKMINASTKTTGKGSNAEVAAANANVDDAKQIQLPFTLDLQRPKRMRLEITFNGKNAVQVFDGKQGWKYRPFLNRKDVEPFSQEESNIEASRGDLDGLLIGYAARGTKVELEGSDLVDSQPAYRLKVSPKGQAVRHVWIDAKTFLDVKIEGFPKRLDGKLHPVYVYQRDFRPVQGVMIPFLQETAVEGDADTHKLLVEKAVINPSFDGNVFAKPQA